MSCIYIKKYIGFELLSPLSIFFFFFFGRYCFNFIVLVLILECDHNNIKVRNHITTPKQVCLGKISTIMCDFLDSPCITPIPSKNAIVVPVFLLNMHFDNGLIAGLCNA